MLITPDNPGTYYPFDNPLFNPNRSKTNLETNVFNHQNTQKIIELPKRSPRIFRKKPIFKTEEEEDNRMLTDSPDIPMKPMKEKKFEMRLRIYQLENQVSFLRKMLNGLDILTNDEGALRLSNLNEKLFEKFHIHYGFKEVYNDTRRRYENRMQLKLSEY